jgi:hypothetical protein
MHTKLWSTTKPQMQLLHKSKLQSLLDIANNETKSKKERLKIQDINAISPKYLGNSRKHSILIKQDCY